MLSTKIWRVDFFPSFFFSSMLLSALKSGLKLFECWFVRSNFSCIFSLIYSNVQIKVRSRRTSINVWVPRASISYITTNEIQYAIECHTRCGYLTHTRVAEHVRQRTGLRALSKKIIFCSNYAKTVLQNSALHSFSFFFFEHTSSKWTNVR